MKKIKIPLKTQTEKGIYNVILKISTELFNDNEFDIGELIGNIIDEEFEKEGLELRFKENK